MRLGGFCYRWGGGPGTLLVPALFAAELLLCAAYAANSLLGEPSRLVTRQLNLDGEANLAAWFSSTQLTLAAILFGVFAWSHFNRRSPRSWLLMLLPAAFLALSADEAAMIHEYIGLESDDFLPGGTREQTVFRRTGVWMLVLGPPTALALMTILMAVRPYLAGAGRSLVKVAAGIGLLILAATVVETLSNFVVEGSLAAHAQLIAEEFLEMAAVTMIVWAALDLLRARGVRIVMPLAGDAVPPSAAAAPHAVHAQSAAA